MFGIHAVVGTATADSTLRTVTPRPEPTQPECAGADACHHGRLHRIVRASQACSKLGSAIAARCSHARPLPAWLELDAQALSR